jgi:colanic acid biosynthesis glycosyl transferase WcaI
LEDLYPDAAVAAGMMRNKMAISFFLGMETFLYQRSQRISVISESFRKSLIEKNVPDSKMTLIPVWADPDAVRPLPKENSFRRQHELSGKFVVMYAGNIGLTSCLEDVLCAAEILREQTQIQFVIVGDGTKKESLESEARRKQLENVRLLPYQPREIYSEMLAAADLSLVTLNARAAVSSLPSKVFNLMASARSILAVAPYESELACIVREAECGWVVPPESPKELAAAIARAVGHEDELIQNGRNGRAYLEEHYSRQRCIDAYENMLLAACQPAGEKSAQARGPV